MNRLPVGKSINFVFDFLLFLVLASITVSETNINDVASLFIIRCVLIAPLPVRNRGTVTDVSYAYIVS